MSKSQRTLGKEPCGVRTSGLHRLCCLRKFQKRSVAAGPDLTANSAHADFPSSAAALLNAADNLLQSQGFLFPLGRVERQKRNNLGGCGGQRDEGMVRRHLCPIRLLV